MMKKTKNPYLHVAYWVFVILVLTMVFGVSWGNKTAAFYFVSMLLPIVMGTSYFFNYVLVPKFYLAQKYKLFAFYTFCLATVSVYLEMVVLVFSYVYLVNLKYEDLNPNSVQITFLAVILYLLVFIGSFLLMMRQIVENRQMIQLLLDEKEKMETPFLEIMSNRKMTQIPYNDIIYIESLSDYIRVITLIDEFKSKERISKLADRLPRTFLRIHRSFIINTNRIKERSYNEVLVDNIRLTIGKSYRKTVKDKLNK